MLHSRKKDKLFQVFKVRYFSKKRLGGLFEDKGADGIYVHHAVREKTENSSSVTIGIAHVMKNLFSGLGYFCPIQPSANAHSKLTREVFQLDRNVSDITQSRAYRCLVDDKVDNLLEEIYRAYELCRRRYDFLIIEGTDLKNAGDILTLNAKIASALAVPALLVTDARLASRIMETSSYDLEGVLDATKISHSIFKHNLVDVLGAVVYNIGQINGETETLSKLFSDSGIPLVGCIPQDDELQYTQALYDKHFNIGIIQKMVLEKSQPPRISPTGFINSIFSRAKQKKQTIVLPEGDEPRTLQAVGAVLQREICNVILLGNTDKIQNVSKALNVDISLAGIIDPSISAQLDKYAEVLYEARKHKGISFSLAREKLKTDPIYFGTCMVAAGDADGMVSGAVHTTANTVRPALQIIKTRADVPIASSIFFICLPNQVLVYGDVAINADPTSEELATIAIASADTAIAFGLEPRIAMLSYATGDSNTGPSIKRVADATASVKIKRPELLIEGPIQYDAAVNPAVAKTKLKGKTSPVAGKANVLIFPDLNSGNIACKAVQQSTGVIAIGPILQGLRKPVNDLSRGCTVQDIIGTIASTAVQASKLKLELERVET